MNELVGLSALHLGSTRVTDVGLSHLNGLTRLKLLDLRETWVSAAGIEEFERRQPSVVIHY